MFNKEDFKFDGTFVTDHNSTQYYWQVKGETAQEIFRNHREMCMRCVNAVFYDESDGSVGIEAQFDVSIEYRYVLDRELVKFVTEIYQEHKKSEGE